VHIFLPALRCLRFCGVSALTFTDKQPQIYCFYLLLPAEYTAFLADYPIEKQFINLLFYRESNVALKDQYW
jgi:hypothetical protein